MILKYAKKVQQIRQAAVVLEFRTCLPTPESDFCLNPLPRNPATAVECGGDGGSASVSRLLESEHIGMRNYKILNGSALPQRHRPSLETLCK